MAVCGPLVNWRSPLLSSSQTDRQTDGRTDGQRGVSWAAKDEVEPSRAPLGSSAAKCGRVECSAVAILLARRLVT